MSGGRRMPWRERIGLHRKELVAWAFYDWANSAFVLIVVTAVFPTYFQRVAQGGGLSEAQATGNFGLVTTVTMTLVALASPVLGAIADFLGRRKTMMAVMLALGVGASAGLFFIDIGDWRPALLLFALGNFGLSTSFVFYDSLLPHIAAGDELDRVSTAGYALGYLGSGLLLVPLLGAIMKPQLFGLPDAGIATRLCFLAVAIWWALFSLPLFRRVPEPPRQIEEDESTAAGAVRVSFARLGETFRELTGDYREAFKMLIAFMIYNDGIGTIIRMAAIYATAQGLAEVHIISAILLVQFIGIPFAFLFGLLAGRIGAKRAVLLGVATYAGISIVAYGMDTVTELYVLSVMVGVVQGGTQGLSRSLFATMVPKHKAAEFFGFFSVFAKVAAIFGPAVFSGMIFLTGSSRLAILSIIVFFFVGGGLLWRVDVEAGRRAAGKADEEVVALGSA